jgi:exopolyphosphatase / guanosine-5'-triphosphate,3'-diphosphate pyrophosphatase
VADRVAALDCGSNSTRLLIVDGDGTTRCREMRITRLAEGVDATGALAGSALRRSFEVLTRYRALMDEHEVTRGLLVATSAVRDASNGAEFLSEARRRAGVETVVLDGRQEAAYSYAGATMDLEATGAEPLVVDVGGGSTELAMMDGTELRSCSMQLGCVRVAERALGRGVVSPESAGLARAMIAAEFDRAFDDEPAFAAAKGRVRVIGLAGTVATLAQLDAGLARYDRAVVHHRRLARDVVAAWRDRLGAQTPAQRLEHPGMIPGREDVLTAGLYVLDAIMERFGADELLSSESDILDGIAASLLGRCA